MSSKDKKIESLAKKRDSVTSRASQFNNYLVGLQSRDIQAADAKHTVTELSLRLQRYELLIQEFDELQIELECLSDNVEDQYKKRDDFENEFYKGAAIARGLLDKYSEINVNNASDSNVRNSDSQNTLALSAPAQLAGRSEQASQLNCIKLPTIDLPKFDGDYNNWLEYRETYDSLIHQNVSINNVQKFHYLKASLVGGALQVVSSIEMTAGNYEIAWSTLCNRYNNMRLLVHNHVKALFCLESIGKESSSKLRKIIDSVSKHLRALHVLNQPTTEWDTLVIHLVATKLDSVTVRHWEQYKADKELPTLKDLNQFLKARADMLETLEITSTERSQKPSQSSKKSYIASTGNTCTLCKAKHNLHNCDEFHKLTVESRTEHVKKNKLCINCLRHGHFSNTCRLGVCKKCGAKHNTLLHADSTVNQGNSRIALPAQFQEQVLLPTAYIQVLDKEGKCHAARALLDSGSQCSFIKESLRKRLRLDLQAENLNISGLSQATSKVKARCNVKIQSNCNAFSLTVSCMVLERITGFLPNRKFQIRDYNIPRNLRLADTSFNTPGEIDILLGADCFWDLLCVGQIKLGRNKPILQKTVFGWVVSGSISGNSGNNLIHCHVSNLELSNQLSRFWESEEIPAVRKYSEEEEACEQHFVKTMQRVEGGRFMVSIPFKASTKTLGESKTLAQRRFLRLEKKLSNNEVHLRYREFLEEYESLGHMSKVVQPDTAEMTYYLPHHGVLKEESITTKLRVVFDASAQTTSGVSLNEIQMVGPTIQSDLLSILLRFRSYAYVVCADIAKMYRQVLVRPEDRPLQRILWRSDPSQPLDTYELNTVTYGTASASFLSTRCLFELANLHERAYTEAARVIKEDFYVDDLVTGANTLQEVITICKTVRDILRGGCFPLRKWIANHEEILRELSEDPEIQSFQFGSTERTKALGLTWSCQSDRLIYDIKTPGTINKITKRSILSVIARIFDPLGLLSPCVILAKIMLQELWQLELTWDESLPSHMHCKWLSYQDELQALNQLSVRRHVMHSSFRHAELHCFSDASEVAFGGCIYVRSTDENGDVFVSLLCAKTKVAPIKRLSVPRLELCGALLTCKLAVKVLESLPTDFERIIFWTDSTIVLSWLQMPSNQLKTFVGNRIARMQEITKGHEWRHVSSKDNPADLLSRGVSPKEIQNSRLWWSGPDWLRTDDWPSTCEHLSGKDLPERRKSSLYSHAAEIDASIFTRFSSFNKMRRVLALCVRFKKNCLSSSENKKHGSITVEEINNTTMAILKAIQIECFPAEILALQTSKPLSRKCRLLPLNPYLDSVGLLRVGGRLRNSDYNFDKIHPIILPVHHVTNLLFVYEHKRLLHAGPLQLLATVREKYWPLSGRRVARKIVRTCIQCFKCKPRFTNPVMGDLPEGRCKPAPPFTTTGVDYAGPFLIKSKRGRGSKLTKGYICLFVCFATKAVHLELVSDLTKDAFIAAMRRFVARRGRPAHVYSDNATNFRGANSELRSLYKFVAENNNSLQDSFANEGITWHFTPARSPHWGGLWEAGVKSTKYHLQRVLGNAHLTFEEFYTVIVQVESVLNSRPISPLSTDPRDLLPLTPAHFLVGRSLTALPDPRLEEVPVNRLSSYQRVQQLTQHFWSRWSKEYVSELQTRAKWHKAQGQLREGDMVLVKDDNLPPMKWSLGRIVSVHVGADSVARVASIRTAKGVVKRSFSKICVLPMNDTDSAQGVSASSKMI